MNTIVGTMAPGWNEAVTAPTITVEHLTKVTEWMYWTGGFYATELRWTFSESGAAVSRPDGEMFVVVVAANGEPLVKHEPLTPGSLGAGRRYAWREILQDIADRIAESD